MKKFKKLLSLVIPMALILSIFTITPIMVVSAEEANLNFDIVTQVREYGQDVTHLIIDVGAPVIADSLDVDTFSVATENYFPTNGNLIYEGEREVTNVYVNTESSITGSSESGQYIIIEMKYGFTITGASAISYSGVNYKLDLNYTITQNKEFILTNNVAMMDATFIQGEVIDLLIEDFDLVTFNDQAIRVYAPESSKALPLVLWNHGGGETYNSINNVNNEGAQLYANMGGVAWIQDEYPTYVLAPQRGNGTGYSRENVIAYIQQLIAEGKVDGSRIYIGGCSAGGGETYNYLLEYASVFAAALPICPSGTMSEELANIIKDVPMWFFHSEDDPTISVSRTQSAVGILRAAGAKEVLYTETANLPYREHGQNGFYNGHWSWIPPLNNYYSTEYRISVFDWLFSQKLDTTFDIVTQVQEYGQDVTHLIIDAGTAVDASTLDLDTFSVFTENYFPTNGNLIFAGEREITNVYVNNEGSIAGSTDSGRYIIVELKYGFTVAGATAISYAGVNYKLNLNYTITQNKDFSFEDGNVANDLVYKQAETQNLGMDDFDLVTFNDQFMRVYAPESSVTLPLIIWNHGAGETYRLTDGVHNEGSQLYANKGGVAWIQEEYPSYVIAPQRGTGTGYSRNNVIAYINELIAEGKVDASRIYVAGGSAGGAETYNYIREFPSYFAAAIPICPAGSITQQQAELIKDIPMWFFHAIDDYSISVNQTRTSVERLQQAGGNEILYTEFENLPYTEHGVDGFYDGHWSWIPPLNNYYSEAYETNVFDWLFAHQSSPVNTSMLEYVVNRAYGFRDEGALNNVITMVQIAFETALANAEAMLTAPSYTLTQAQVNDAIRALQTTFEYLSFIAVDKTDLAYLIELVEPDEANEELYIASTFATFIEALNAAREVMANGNLLEGIDEDIVIEAWTNLIDAWVNLRRIPSKENLANLIQSASMVDVRLYTEPSVVLLNETLIDARSILENIEATQEEVNEATNDLRLALDNLVLLETKKEIPLQSDDDSSTLENNDMDNLKKQETQGQRTVVTMGNGVPRTGDATNYTSYIGLGLLATAGLVVGINKKGKKVH